MLFNKKEKVQESVKKTVEKQVYITLKRLVLKTLNN